MLRPHSHSPRAQVFRYVIASLIVASVVIFVLDSEPYIHERYRRPFLAFEGVTSCVFLAEWCLRLWTIPESRKNRSKGPWAARWGFLSSWSSLISVLAFLPWFVEICARAASCDLQLPNLSFLRVFSLVRLLRAAPVAGAFEVIARVIYYNNEILLVALLICAVMILITSTLLFYLAPAGTRSEDFSSIPATMYLSVMMLTGQGQPEGALPWYTKLIVICTSIFSVAQFAIPASMLTWGFEQEAQRRVKRNLEADRKQRERLRQGLAPFEESSCSSNPGTDSSWEDYEKIAAAADESDSDDVEASSRRALSSPDVRRTVRPQSSGRLSCPALGAPGELPAGAGGELLLSEAQARAPDVLMQIVTQLTALQQEVARLSERNVALEAENARLRGS